MKFRSVVKGRKVISEHGQGTIKAVWEAHGGAMGMFDTRTRNDLMRSTLLHGGEFWCVVFLPQRFTDYAKRLGYSVSSKYQDRKTRLGLGDTPLVFLGVLRKAALAGAAVTSTATTGRQSVRIAIPYGEHTSAGKRKGKGRLHGISPEVPLVLKELPPWEIQRVCDTIEKDLVRAIQGKAEEELNRPTAPAARSPGVTKQPGSRPGRGTNGRFTRARK